MMALGERGFLAEAQKRIGGFLGEISLAGPRSSYPLGLSPRRADHGHAPRAGRATPRTASTRLRGKA
jgi:hypothetical protein